MVSVINYDRPVKNLIAGLDATGHVTHTAYRKTSVTFHHNGGRLSHEGVLEVWKTREASAQFDVDGHGDVAQYVRVNEYAWATGNTQGNKESISIELANATLAPDYVIADVTWQSGARLAGWLFARVIGARPTRDTVHLHHDWKSTLCAGPFMDKIREQLFLAVEAAYNEFAGSGPAPTPPAPSPRPVKSVEEIAQEVIDGKWGTGPDRVARLTSAGYDAAAVQAEVNRRVGGGSGPAPRKSVSDVAREVIAGDWGNEPQRGQRLQAAGYSPSEVQAEVNRQLGAKVGPAPTRLSVNLLASQVIAGQWGKGPERIQRLTASGYDAAAVQAEVNRRLLKR
jgi:hypothetical protein